jgi:hypothetical protein
MVHFLGFMIKLDPTIALTWFLIFLHSDLLENAAPAPLKVVINEGHEGKDVL